MHGFTRSTWTHEDTERKRERLEKISDDELERELVTGNHMCQPSLRPVRESYRIQRELARLEICRRGAAYGREDLFTTFDVHGLRLVE
jgi:hypothetical protein